jgi:integrase
MNIPVALNAQELRALLAETRQQDTTAYVLFLLTVCHGLRVTEAISLRRRNFSTTAGVTYLTVQRLKGSKKTTQRLLTNADSLFDEASVVTMYLSMLKGDRLFPEYTSRWCVTRLVEKYGKAAGVPEHKRFVHALKHTTGMTMRLAGAKLEEIQTVLGHERLDSTAQYLRVSTDEADEARDKAFAAVAGGE